MFKRACCISSTLPPLRFFLLALLSPLFATAAFAQTATTEPVTVRVFNLPSKRAATAREVALYRMVERFHQLHPDIRLVSSTPLQIAGQGAKDATVLMSIAGGTAPDIISVNFRQSDTFISKGFLLPLDEFVEELKKNDAAEFARRVPANVEPVMHRDGPSGKHYWAFPTAEPIATVLQYRKDTFRAAGLDPEHPPADWNELQEFARKITDPSKGIFGIGFYAGNDAAWSAYSFISSAGAEAVRQEPDGSWKAVFDSDAAVRAFEFIYLLQKEEVTRNGKKGPLAYRGADLGDRVGDGKIGMWFTEFSGDSIGASDPQLVGIAAAPRGPTNQNSALVNCPMMGIFAGQKDPRVQRAAWEYIRYYNSKEAREIYTRTMVEMGAAGACNPRWLREFGYDELADLAPKEVEQTFQAALEHGVPEPYGKNCQYVYIRMSEPIDQIFFTQGLDQLPEDQRRAKIKTILQKAVAATNEKMLGTLPPETRQSRNLVAWIIAVCAVFAFAAMVRQIFIWMNAGKAVGGEPTSAYKTRLAIGILAPAMLLILWWHYWPLVRGSLMGFQNYNLMGDSPWVGINNFADVIFDVPRFWMPLKNAAYFCVLWLVMGFLPPVLLAVMLQEIPKGKIFFRILFYLPAVVSGIVILFMWRQFYDPSPDGILNKVVGFIGVPPQKWLDEPQGIFFKLFSILHFSPEKWMPMWFPDPSLAMFCVVFPLAWAHLGPGCIIYLAALKGVPDELYEAADIDGASFFRKLRYIVLPYLKPLLVINLVGATIGGFKSGDAVLAMTGGGPNLTTHVVGYEIWQSSFLFLNFGRATAAAWILGLLLLAFTAYQLRILNKVEFRNVGK